MWCADLSFLCIPTQSIQLCLTLCHPMDCGPPGSSVHGIFLGCHFLLQRIFPTLSGSGTEPEAPASCTFKADFFTPVLPRKPLSPLTRDQICLRASLFSPFAYMITEVFCSPFSKVFPYSLQVHHYSKIFNFI